MKIAFRGQLMPPIMGASAFIMADITGIAYSKICLAAIVPVLLYYTGCFAMVHLRACKLGLRGLAKEDCPKLLLVLKEDGYLFLPFIFVVVMLCVGYTVTWVGVRAIPLCVLIAACKKKTRLGLKDIWQCLQLSAGCSTGIRNLRMTHKREHLPGNFSVPAPDPCPLSSGRAAGTAPFQISFHGDQTQSAWISGNPLPGPDHPCHSGLQKQNRLFLPDHPRPPLPGIPLPGIPLPGT